MIKIPYGLSNFERIRTKNFLYVDKTHFIEKIEWGDYLMHLRPRRFGKSLFISMLESYYDIASADKFDELFKGLYIHENPTDYQNSYYMLRFDFSGIENVEKGDLQRGFVEKVSGGAQAFIDKYKFDIKLSKSTSATSVLRSLFMGFTSLNLPNKIYILIDEYDHFTNSILEGDASEFLNLLKRGGLVRPFYEEIKERAGLGIVERIFITGVMSITLDSMTSGFNIATRIMTDETFTDVMGFTEEEVKAVLGLSFSDSGKVEEVVKLTDVEQVEILNVFRENYNGYLFSKRSNIKIFNSTLIMYYLQHYVSKKYPPESLVDPNLNQSSAMIENIVGLKTPESNSELIQEIIDEIEIEGTLEPFIDIEKKFDQNDVITMLHSLGILTLKKSDYGTMFEIPNLIIKRIYLQYLSELKQRQVGYMINTRKQTLAFSEIGRTGKVAALTKIVEDILMHTSNQNALDLDEKHVKFCYFMLTHITEDFVVYDEFPSRRGYGDLFIQKANPSKAKYEVFIEFKYLTKTATNDESVEKKLQEGITQIEGYLKDKRLVNREGLRKYVIVFSGYEAVKIHEINNIITPK